MNFKKMAKGIGKAAATGGASVVKEIAEEAIDRGEAKVDDVEALIRDAKREIIQTIEAEMVRGFAQIVQAIEKDNRWMVRERVRHPTDDS